MCESSSPVGIGDLLSGSWELTQRIFDNLSFREVARLRGVCKLWADVGAKTLERRRKLHYLTVHPHHIPTTEGKVIFGDKSPFTLFEKFFEHIVSKPRYCIGFCNEDWLDTGDSFGKDKDKENLRLAQYLLNSLPSTCDFSLISASGIIGTVEQEYQGMTLESANNVNRELLSMLCPKEQEGATRSKRIRKSSSLEDMETERRESSSESCSSSDSGTTRTVGYSIEVEARCNSLSGQRHEAATLLLIPHHPGVKLKFFHLNEETFYKNYRQDNTSNNLVITKEEFNGLTTLTEEDDLKALLLFDVGLDEVFTSAFLQSALERQNNKLAIGGGVVECFDYGKKDPRKETDLVTLGIAVCGPNVMAASVVIPKSVGHPKALDDYMNSLKSCGLPEGQSLAFMFTCCGRGYSWYRRRGNPWFDFNNVETKAFKKFFPNTPVFGFFGGGEIGLSFLPKFNDPNVENEEAPQKKRKRKLHQFTTIIVLLSFL